MFHNPPYKQGSRVQKRSSKGPPGPNSVNGRDGLPHPRVKCEIAHTPHVGHGEGREGPISETSPRLAHQALAAGSGWWGTKKGLGGSAR